MEKINTIIIANNATGEVALCKSDTPLEYNAVISSLEGLTIGPDKINDVDGIVRDNIKGLGLSIEDIGHTDVQEPDMTIILVDGMPLVWANTKYKNKAIFVGEIYGNCIDRFMAHNMNTFMSNVRVQANKIENGNALRMNEKNYHDSAVFETDFAALTELKELCLKMAKKIQKLQENLTNNNYTA
jgi:hypothetical protein